MQRIACLFILAGFIPASSALAATVSFLSSVRLPPASAIAADPSLEGHKIYEFFLTSSADILSVDQVAISSGPLFQGSLGSDLEPPLPILFVPFPYLEADSWINTPGVTSIAGGGFGHDNSSWFDTSYDGPVTYFQFARLTAKSFNSFSGRVNVAGDAGPENFPFNFVFVPEPALHLTLAGLLLCLATRRRHGRLSWS